MWVDRLKSYFPPAARARGEAYVARMELLEVDAGRLHAHVRGSAEYCLKLERQSAVLRGGCSCPYFEGNGPCKHLWAVLKFAHQRQMWQEPPAISVLSDIDIDDDVQEYTPPPRPAPRQPAWREDLKRLRSQSLSRERVVEAGAELIYILDVASSESELVVEVVTRVKKRDGQWARPRALTLYTSQAAQLPNADDRELIPLLAALDVENFSYYGYRQDGRLNKQTKVRTAASRSVIVGMAATGRLYLRLDGGAELLPCAWAEAPYRLVLRAHSGDELRLRGELQREGAARPLLEALLILPEVVVFRDHAAPLELAPGASKWIRLLAERNGELRAPVADADALIEELHQLPDAPPLLLPEALRLEERQVLPAPWLVLRSPAAGAHSDRLVGELRLDYSGAVIGYDDPRSRFKDGKVVYLRDRDAEERAAARLRELSFRHERLYPEPGLVWSLGSKKLDEAVRALTLEGWRVEAEGKLFRAPGKVAIDVVSGIDWFDVSAEVSYGGELRASLPALLLAQRRSSGFVRLDDGSYGLLPEEWLARHGLLTQIGTVEGDGVRFKRRQIGLLDALLSTMPEARGDAELAKARAAFARFDGVRSKNAPRGFTGTLRAYQREGLGWLEFLREFGFGGCLADDMGLGKTIQALALLASRPRKKPSIVVVPQSLIFNWRREAARFTPKLKVYEHHGAQRSTSKIKGHDLVVTTYGTLVRDIAELRKIDFDYAILDEAQAIKNSSTESARAARLLTAEHRLVLTGTPVENRLADLWSLFEFLNPGMLGSATAFKHIGGRETGDDASRALLSRAVRPFILRRTKEQVARDLPAKTEQVIYCELEGSERKKYDELRAYYRGTLLGLVDKKGMAGAQMHILEALLRLRQAACHPGLIDGKRSGEKSAKLTALLEQLDEVVQGGHKALVFSQFTTLLGIVKQHLDQANIAYEYLDGRTRDRQAKVDRFQTDSTCPVFLVSLKAGGVGLNLTAAEYVFLLDPWWNPAVEAQAVDRTHRIGQSRAVFAYRLIGRDTIEEKVLALQAKKKHLAEAIITADNSLLASIGREELDLLLS